MASLLPQDVPSRMGVTHLRMNLPSGSYFFPNTMGEYTRKYWLKKAEALSHIQLPALM